MPVTVRGTDILFNDGTSQLTAAANLSVHQGIGSIIVAWNTTTTSISAGGNIAGGSLRFVSALSSAFSSPSEMFVRTQTTVAGFSPSGFPTGSTSVLSGTWRSIGGFCSGRKHSTSTGDYSSSTTTFFYPSLWLRIA